MAKMQAGFDALHPVMSDRHPEAGCLPLPPLTFHENPRDLAIYSKLIGHMLDSAEAWQAARDHCGHCPTYAIRELWRAWRKWQQLTWQAYRYLTGTARTNADMHRSLNELYAALTPLTQPDRSLTHA